MDLVRVGVISLATGFIGLILAMTPFGSSLEERFGLSWLYSLRGPINASNDVVVVGLDRRSADGLGLPEKIRDWPRDLYADLIDRLVAGQVSVIAFDLILEDKREPRFDAAFVEATATAERVVLFEAMELKRKPTPGALGAAVGFLETQRIRPPFKALADEAAGLGPFPLPIVPDRVSQAWLFNPGAGGRPTLPAVVMQQHALSVYDRWLSLVKRAGAHGLDSLPGDSHAIDGALDLRRVMMAFRAAFLADPDLGERVRTAIGQAADDAPSQRLLRALVNLYDGPDSRYLNFYGPAGQIRTLSLADLVEEDGDPGLWRGRAAFVGQSELLEPQSDSFITTYSKPDGVNIAGVEIAATVFANLLDGSLLTPSRWWLPAIAGFGLVVGMTAALLPPIGAVPACLLIAGLYLAGAAHLFAGHAIWLPTTMPLLVELPLGLFTGLFMQYRQARRARENLSKAIRYYLPDKIAAGFADATITPLLEDEEAYAYCMITDAGGFTRLAETMTSKQLKPFLEDYLEILFEAVKAHGGRVTDSVGDGITAAWTSPTPDPDVAAKACQAALAIDREVELFNTRHAPLHLPTRIGLNAGRVTLGHVGGAGRFTYTVVGDAVNTASRIEQLNKHLSTRILATRAVVKGLPDLALRPLGRFQLFGKEEVLEIFELLDKLQCRCKEPLLTRFAAALIQFNQRNWHQAADIFSHIATRDDDLTAHFYLRACRQYLTNSVDCREPPIIRLSKK